NRTRIITSLAQPVLFLFVLGSGLSPILPGGNGSVDYRTFMFPGVLAMTVLFTSMFSAVSIVWDREFGFLREMLVAPVRRSALIIGKCLGGATVATLQGTILLALAGFVHVPYSPTLLLVLVLEMAMTAMMLTAIGVMIASRLETIESFQVLMQLIALPMFFLSGAVFPLNRLPRWLATLTRIDPLTYAVDPMRRAVFDHLSVPAATRNGLVPGLTWGGWRVPTVLELGIVIAVSTVCLSVAVVQFSRAD
ncbi:MAG: ABC transporter permease, partial [Actinomycetota bacterium]|nr:ABC transporter permease [Actinomycetota bacterium]